MTVEVRLSNIGPRARTVQVVERVPVSEIDKVRIEMDTAKTSDGCLPDGDGMVRWERRLEPFGQGRVMLNYILRKHEDVVGI